MIRRFWPRCAALGAAFRRDWRAATAVEFALVGMPFLAMLVAIFELAYVHLESELLNGAVAKASRAMLTGQVQANSAVTNATTFINTYLCPSSGPRLMPANFDCGKLIVDVRPVTSFSTADMTNDIYKGSTEFCPGTAGAIVLMRVAYPLPAIFPLNLFNQTVGTVNDVPGQSGNYHILLGAALFQEEAFTNAYAPPTGC